MIDTRKYRNETLQEETIEYLKLLKQGLVGMDYEDKIDFISSILCEEWYLNVHQKYISEVLQIFADSLK